MGRGPEGVSTSGHEPSETDDCASCGVVGRSDADVDGRLGDAVTRSVRDSTRGDEVVRVSSESSRWWAW